MDLGHTDCCYTRAGVWEIEVRWQPIQIPNGLWAYQYRTSDVYAWRQHPDIHTHLRYLWGDLYRLASDPLV
jgi:hypothetical protein